MQMCALTPPWQKERKQTSLFILNTVRSCYYARAWAVCVQPMFMFASWKRKGGNRNYTKRKNTQPNNSVDKGANGRWHQLHLARVCVAIGDLFSMAHTHSKTSGCSAEESVTVGTLTKEALTLWSRYLDFTATALQPVLIVSSANPVVQTVLKYMMSL